MSDVLLIDLVLANADWPKRTQDSSTALRTRMLGGPGSGNFGHGGRPGEVGGSGEGGDGFIKSPVSNSPRQKAFEKSVKNWSPDAQKISDWAFEHQENRDLEFTLAQAPQYEGIVYRGVGDNSHLGSLQVGKTISISETVSTSRSPEVAQFYLKDPLGGGSGLSPTLMVIKTGAQEDISSPSFVSIERIVPKDFRKEEEVVMRRGTSLKITGIRKLNNFMVVELTETRQEIKTLAKKIYTVHTVADTFVPALKKAIISSFNPSSVKDEEAASAFLESWEARVREAMIPVLHRVLVTSGTLHGLKMRVSEGFRSAKQPPIKSKIGKLGLKFDVANPKAIKWARERAAELAVDMVETTKKSVRSIIARGFTEGRHPYQTAKLLVEVIGLTERQGEALMAYRDTLEEQGYSERDIDDEVSSRSNEMFEARAETIARTETMRASNEGQQELWEQAADEGLLTGFELREWIVTPDDRLCAVCEAMEGQTAAMGEPFDVDGEDVMVPPAHPNCRCTIGISAESPGPENLEARALGGPGSGNFGHSGRPGEVGGSGEGDSNEATSASRGFGRVRADLEEQTKWTESRPQLTEAIVRYTGDDYKAINSSLREGNPNADAQEIVKGLEEVPPLERPVVVFRGLKGSPGGTGEKIAAMTPGTEIILNGLQSASTNPLNALKFGKTLLRIEATKGIFIKGKSLIKSENEFLMNHGHRFVVKSNADQGDGVKIITLRQVA